MWGAWGETPEPMEGELPEPMSQAKEKCEQNRSQLELLKEIMLKNKQTLKKKEEEVQEYARRLSKIKSRAKMTRRSKEGAMSGKDTSQSPKPDVTLVDELEEVIEDISQAKTPKAKSTLLQKKLAENRKVFEQRSKEMTETKRAVEEKVEAIKQQLEEKETVAMALQKDQLSVTPVRPVMITSEVMSPIQIEDIQEKQNKIVELNNKILDLQAIVLDLQENLKEKDSVIESKTRAVTLMSADLSKKGKTTLDTLEDTKDEMRTMQEHFVLVETSLKTKNDSLLQQLKERGNKITELEETIRRYEQQVNEQMLSESASADFSRNTMDTLVETKDAMKSMQENFVLIESSLKAKNDNLLQQMQDYETKLAEANERIFHLESGLGIVKDPTIDELKFKLEKLENSNKQLQDDKHELQKTIAEMQDRIVNTSIHGSGAIMEKDNRIAEYENLVEELKQSNKLLEEESKGELQKQLTDLTLKNEEYFNKITDFEKLVHDLEAEKNEIASRLSDESTAMKEDEKVASLTKELEDLNKTMIKIKAQHRSKVKNLQKQLENFKMVSDTNAELVRLGNQVALLEEEKGNLQLSLVDFDELKASAGDWQERIGDLETKVSAQTKEIQMHIEAIAILENQKLDLTQELHTTRQEISTLEAENAESENLRVTAEMKVVDLEEQLESLHEARIDSNVTESSSSLEANHDELLRRIEALTQEKTELYNKVLKMEEKGTSDTGSTESFEAIQESDKSELLKKIEDLSQKNEELTLRLNKHEEKGTSSQAGSTESFETINDTDKNELLKKIEQLTQENNDLMMKLSRSEEKGSSDTGSTESFERIPEHGDSLTKIELLTQENHELVIKLTKLEEQLGYVESGDAKSRLENVLRENDNQSIELTKLRDRMTEINEENDTLQKRIEALKKENTGLADLCGNLEERIAASEAGKSDVSKRSKREADTKDQIDVLTTEKELLAKEAKELREANNDSQLRIEELWEEKERMISRVAELEELSRKLEENLKETTREKEDAGARIEETDDFAKERLELIDKLEKLNREKLSVSQERQELQEQISTLLQRSKEESAESQQADESVSRETESMIVASLERDIEEHKKLIAEQTGLLEEMKMKLANKEEELEEKGKLIAENEASGMKIESLETELKEMLNTIEEWRYKCNEMQEKMSLMETSKASIEEGFKKLQNEHEILLEENKAKEAAADSLKQQLESTITLLESRLQEELVAINMKDSEISVLKESMEEKDQELSAKYLQLQNEMIAVDNLQDKLNIYWIDNQEKDAAITSMSEEIANLNDAVINKEEEMFSINTRIIELSDQLQDSRPSKDFDELLENLTRKDIIIKEIESRINAVTRDNNDLTEKVTNLSRHNAEIQDELTAKREELVGSSNTKEHLEAQITEMKNEKTDNEKRIWELQNILDNNSRFVEDLQTELNNGYKQMEKLKEKHTEDLTMQQQRLETVIEDLNGKTQECETLKIELQEKSRLIGENVTEETKLSLEANIAELKKKLSDSEDKIQAQLEKMKKIAATLKKKSATCQELETRVAELEEKWTSEKDEKEATNKRIQEVEIAMREKDNSIAELEEKLINARHETSEALKEIDALANYPSKTQLTEQVAELNRETMKLREDLESCSADLAAEREAKEKISNEYESYKQSVLREEEQKQVDLDDVKERARELSVRMQVMESEYVEQLAFIKNLQAENGLLMSKQTHINEKLEIAEKESEERRVLIEQLQKDILSTSTATTQTTDEEGINAVGEESSTPAIQICAQYQTEVQTLEEKLQKQEAKIEKLENELANSVGNFVQMRESPRFNDLMNQTAMRNRSFEEHYNELLEQYNALTSSHEELKEKLINVLGKNQRLEESAAKLKKKCDEREVEFLNFQKEMADVREAADRLESQLRSQLSVLHWEKEQLARRGKSLTDEKASLKEEVEDLKRERSFWQQMIDNLEIQLDEYKKAYFASKKEPTIVDKGVSAFDRAPDEQGNEPPLFDASKLFVALSGFMNNNEITKLQNLLEEKEVLYSNLTQEMDHLQRSATEERSRIMEELRISRVSLHAKQMELERIEGLLSESTKETESLEALKAELNSTKEILNEALHEREQQNHTLESYRLQIANLEAEARNSTDPETIQELEQRVAAAVQERDLLQLQLNDLMRSTEESKNSEEIVRRLNGEIEKIRFERDEVKELTANLTEALEESRRSLAEKTLAFDELSSKKSSTIEECSSTKASLRPTEASLDEATTQGDFESTWDTGSGDRFNVDDETWGWNAEDAVQLGVTDDITATLVPSVEIRLRAQLADLEDRVKELEAEKEKILDDNKAVQLRSAKMLKKLKEYKVQMDSLQQQLKIQKSTSEFYGLDSAIEEELKSQIARLEKELNEAKEELKNTTMERESLTKRLDVVVSANERYMEMKERQDMDMEVLRIRNKELTDRIEALSMRLQENSSGSFEDGNRVQPDEDDPTKEEVAKAPQDRPRKRSIDQEDLEALCKKYRDEMDDLKDEMEALATENEQLQHVLEDQKNKLSSLESRRITDENDSVRIVEELHKRIAELQGMLAKSKEEYELLRRQYEQSLMDANDQVSAMRENSDFLKADASEKIGKLEMEIDDLRQSAKTSYLRTKELEKSLLDLVQEKSELEEKLSLLRTTSDKQLTTTTASMAEVTELLNSRIQELADLKQELQRQYIDYEEAKAGLQANVQKLTEELAGKRQELETLRESFGGTERELIQQRSVETVSALVSQATQELVQKHAIELEQKDKDIRAINERMSTLQLTVDEYLWERKTNIVRMDEQQQALEKLKKSLVKKDSLLGVVNEKLSTAKEEVSKYERQLHRSELENQRLLKETSQMEKFLDDKCGSLKEKIRYLKDTLAEKKEAIEHYDEEGIIYKAKMEDRESEIHQLRADLKEIQASKMELEEKDQLIQNLNAEIKTTRDSLEETRETLREKLEQLEETNRLLKEKNAELIGSRNEGQTNSSVVDDLPLFKMPDDSQTAFQSTIDSLQAELEEKEEEIEHLEYVLSENTYPGMIQEMQERINCLFNEKTELELALEVSNQRLTEKEKQVDDLTQKIQLDDQDLVSKEEATTVLSRERRSVQVHDEIVRMQNELHAKDQEINDLRYIIAEKDSQLSLQASMEPQSDDFELRETAQRLMTELYTKEQEIQHLRSTIAELQTEASRWQDFERLSNENKEALQRLTAEKEQVRLEAQEFLEKTLVDKEAEISEIKERLSMENRSILEELRLRENDIQNLNKQLEESLSVEQGANDKLREKDSELSRVNTDLAERDRRLAELSITKDTELHNLNVQIREKEARIEELLMLSEEEERQLVDLRNTLVARETEINTLKKLLEDKLKEYELIQNALKKDVPIIETVPSTSSTDATGLEEKESASQELDLALYMLHQRDVRCEELTHELMQLLEERDTLQLRLSNAIRVNEDLRRTDDPVDAHPKTDKVDEEASASGSEEPLVEHPSFSKSEGPVEIAKEAIDASIGEDKEALALKLSQLHTVSHTKDVRLRDERELRHTQQMSLLAHKDVLSTLPPEAAARLVNANYTLSRDVQSQSSVLLNWLWGKSTPKVVHM